MRLCIKRDNGGAVSYDQSNQNFHAASAKLSQLVVVQVTPNFPVSKDALHPVHVELDIFSAAIF